MLVKRFDGGLATRLAPHLIDRNEGVIYENIDNTRGLLEPVKGPLGTGQPISQYAEWYDVGNEWVSSVTPVEYLEYQRRLYSFDGVKPQVYRDGAFVNLGLPVPDPLLDAEGIYDSTTPSFPLLNDIQVTSTLGYTAEPYSIPSGNDAATDLALLIESYRAFLGGTGSRTRHPRAGERNYWVLMPSLDIIRQALKQHLEDSTSPLFLSDTAIEKVARAIEHNLGETYELQGPLEANYTAIPQADLENLVIDSLANYDTARPGFTMDAGRVLYYIFVLRNKITGERINPYHFTVTANGAGGALPFTATEVGKVNDTMVDSLLNTWWQDNFGDRHLTIKISGAYASDAATLPERRRAADRLSLNYDLELFRLNAAGRWDIVDETPKSLIVGQEIVSGVEYTTIQATISDKSYGQWVEDSTVHDSTVSLGHSFPGMIHPDLGVGQLDAVRDMNKGPEGTYQYAYTYYNSETGAESVLSSPSDSTEVKYFPTVLHLPDWPTGIDADRWRIYRVGGAQTQFSLVSELPVVNPLDTTRFDVWSDTEIEGSLFTEDLALPPPNGLQNVSTSYGMLFGSVESTLHFTAIGKPGQWPPQYSIEFEGVITGTAPVVNGLLVFTKTRTHIVTGTGPDTLAVQLLRGDQGCISHASIQEVYTGAVIWASLDGLCISSGNNVKSLSKKRLGKLELQPIGSAVSDEVYYLIETTGSILAYDYRFHEPIFKRFSFNVDNLFVKDDKLFGHWNGELVECFEGDFVPFTFKSANFTEGAYTNEKAYKKLFVHADTSEARPISVKMIIDDIDDNTHNLTTKDSHQLFNTTAKQRGYSYQLEITGTGIVNEIDYNPKGNYNGK